MLPPSATVHEAIQRIAARPEGAAILEYLQAAMFDINARLIATMDPVQLRIFQGEGRVVDMLLKQWKP